MPVAAIIMGLFLCREKTGSKGKLIYCVGAGAGLFAVAAIRYAVGYDYILYANWFGRLRFMSGTELTHWSREKGFAIPAKFLADMFPEPQIMFALIAFAVTAGVMLLIYKRSPVPWVSVAAFLTSGLFFISMNFMRQFIAAVIIAFALRYVAKKRFCRFAGLILFASVFHYSALLLLPFYFLLKIKLNYISLSLMLTASIIIYMFVTPLMDIATNFFYTRYDPVTHIEAANGLSPVYTIVFALFFALAFMLRNMLKIRNKHANTLLVSMYFAVFFGLLGTSHAILSRLALLFIIAPILILSADIYTILRDLILLMFKGSKKNTVVWGALVSLFFLCINGLYYHYLLSVNFNGVVPYQTVFDRQEVET